VVVRRSGLGRGLGSLIPPEVANDQQATLREIPLAQIQANQFQPRRSFGEEALSSLVDSIRSVGVLQPVLVRQVGDEFELIAGERRCRAARRAGLVTIPALVQSASDESSLERALVENLHREDLNPLDEAAAYKQLVEDFDLTQEEVARRVGRSRVAVTNAIRLLQLPPSVQVLVRDGQLSPGHARALLMTPDRDLQERLGAEAAVAALSVRALEELVRGLVADDNERTDAAIPEGGSERVPPTGAAGPRRLRPPGVLELEELLADHLNTRVKVDMGANHGRVIVEFATLEDLERIYRIMIGERPT
jgi:ParB family transcriptional regulator, chromosome partitioning protein